jgi:hypothetical protein
MKKILFLSIITVLVSCNTREKKYEIRGKIYIPSMGPTSMHDAIWYTDTISFDGDTAYYFNSDGSEVRIYPPFIIKHLD